jgi:hypothetical protein
MNRKTVVCLTALLSLTGATVCPRTVDSLADRVTDRALFTEPSPEAKKILDELDL